MNVVASSTTIDFSCVTANAGVGIEHVDTSFQQHGSRTPFWISPLMARRVQQDRIFTLRLCAFTSALSSR